MGKGHFILQRRVFAKKTAGVHKGPQSHPRLGHQPWSWGQDRCWGWGTVQLLLIRGGECRWNHPSGSVFSCSVLPCRAKEPESLLVSLKCEEQGAAGLLHLPHTFLPTSSEGRNDETLLTNVTTCAQKQAQGQ